MENEQLSKQVNKYKQESSSLNTAISSLRNEYQQEQKSMNATVNKLQAQLETQKETKRENYLLTQQLNQVRQENKKLQQMVAELEKRVVQQPVVLKFNSNYKSRKAIIATNGKSAWKSNEKGPFWILAGGDSVTQGIAVWRMKVWFV